jgi:hypothetical protein
MPMLYRSSRAPPLAILLWLWARNHQELEEDSTWLEICTLEYPERVSHLPPGHMWLRFPGDEGARAFLDNWGSCHTAAQACGETKLRLSTQYQFLQSEMKITMLNVNNAITSALEERSMTAMDMVRNFRNSKASGDLLEDENSALSIKNYVSVSMDILSHVFGDVVARENFPSIPRPGMQSLFESWFNCYASKFRAAKVRKMKMMDKAVELVAKVVPSEIHLTFYVGYCAHPTTGQEVRVLPGTTTASIKTMLLHCRKYIEGLDWQPEHKDREWMEDVMTALEGLFEKELPRQTGEDVTQSKRGFSPHMK